MPSQPNIACQCNPLAPRVDSDVSQTAQGGALNLRARWVPLLVGGVLLSAALLKAQSLFADSPVESGIFQARRFQVMLVEAELACGLALWLALWPRVTRWAAMLLFAAFFGVALSQALGGARSCTCFGSNVQVQPWLAVVLDVGMMLALVSWNVARSPVMQRPVIDARFAIAVALLGFVSFHVALIAFAPSQAAGRHSFEASR
ncbi:MAG: hypothetical protein L0215_07425 [Gemmataceae bacterium]|nr:hypothetical protein [Gemmataceae bacterium]